MGTRPRSPKGPQVKLELSEDGSAVPIPFLGAGTLRRNPINAMWECGVMYNPSVTKGSLE